MVFHTTDEEYYYLLTVLRLTIIQPNQEDVHENRL